MEYAVTFRAIKLVFTDPKRSHWVQATLLRQHWIGSLR